MFKLAVSATYLMPVKVEIPVDGGKTQPVTFEAEFKRLSQTEMDNVSERIATNQRRLRMTLEQLDAMSDETRPAKFDDRMLIDEVMVGWKGVADQDGVELVFSPTNLEALLAVNPVRKSIAEAYFNSINGAKRKN